MSFRAKRGNETWRILPIRNKKIKNNLIFNLCFDFCKAEQSATVFYCCDSCKAEQSATVFKLLPVLQSGTVCNCLLVLLPPIRFAFFGRCEAATQSFRLHPLFFNKSVRIRERAAATFMFAFPLGVRFLFPRAIRFALPLPAAPAACDPHKFKKNQKKQRTNFKKDSKKQRTNLKKLKKNELDFKKETKRNYDFPVISNNRLYCHSRSFRTASSVPSP
ncbi:hypothetical protein MmiHf6_01600 [Methanimicrococcus hongohii]|uniref:Uncharacterized protein n=1 Tax=Methanimicrococcus hongohii TaxID=3028295 RepID=A0AA96UYC5_9EURY|nr:hypothetical protein MmiHf6_01600 [Methanimicrococcus sp. Hf6]